MNRTSFMVAGVAVLSIALFAGFHATQAVAESNESVSSAVAAKSFSTPQDAQSSVPFELMVLPLEAGGYIPGGTRVITHPTLTVAQVFYWTPDGRQISVLMTNSKHHKYTDEDNPRDPSIVNGLQAEIVEDQNEAGDTIGVVAWKRGTVTIVVSAVRMKGIEVLPIASALRPIGT